MNPQLPPQLSWLFLSVLLGLAGTLIHAPEKAAAQIEALEIERLESRTQGLARYRMTIQPGASLFYLATEHLPLTALDEGNEPAVALVEQAFHRAFPGQDAALVQPGQSFELEIPDETFVTETIDRTPGQTRYISFDGDELTVPTPSRHVVYRLVRQDNPRQVEVLLSGLGAVPLDLAREIYAVEQPDFIQVRYAREAVGQERLGVVVDLDRPYLDDFRNYRGRAATVEPGENGMTVYTFTEAQIDVPFLRVADAVRDQTDVSEFPHLFRVEYFKDGTIRQVLITQPGDMLDALQAPDNDAWADVYQDWETWSPGEASALEPFAPPLDSSGRLIGGRMLVLTHEPRPVSAAGSGLECLGIPLLLVFGATALRRVRG